MKQDAKFIRSSLPENYCNLYDDNSILAFIHKSLIMSNTLLGPQNSNDVVDPYTLITSTNPYPSANEVSSVIIILPPSLPIPVALTSFLRIAETFSNPPYSAVCRNDRPMPAFSTPPNFILEAVYGVLRYIRHIWASAPDEYPGFVHYEKDSVDPPK